MVGGINTMAMQGLSALGRAQDVVRTALERLATGKRINRASDDPSGLIVAEGLDVEQRVIARRIDGLEMEGLSLAAREGTQGVVADMLTDLQGLTVQAANRAGLSDAERDSIQREAEEIIKGIDFVYATSTFKGQQLFAGFSSANLGMSRNERMESEDGGERAGADAPGGGAGDGGERWLAVRHTLLDLVGAGAANLAAGDTELAQDIVKAAAASVNGQRQAIGARLGDLEHQRNALSEQLIQVADAHSRIMDADFAVEATRLFRAKLMQQVAVRATQIAIQGQSERVLKLLQVPAAARPSPAIA